jgi:hypothetical protein
MSEHLPECLAAPVDYAISSFASPCICDRLRQAEQRVRAELVDRGFLEWSGRQHRKSYAAGVKAAREAVIALGMWVPPEVLDAIDGVKP